jgi:hypothetical protein
MAAVFLKGSSKAYSTGRCSISLDKIAPELLCVAALRRFKRDGSNHAWN